MLTIIKHTLHFLYDILYFIYYLVYIIYYIRYIILCNRKKYFTYDRNLLDVIYVFKYIDI